MTSFGASLRRERELRGVSLQEIASATRIGVSFLRAIEEDRFDRLPQGAFVRGFVREYARFLALDEEKTLNELSMHVAHVPAASVIARSSEDHPSNHVASRLANFGVAGGIIALVAMMILSPSLTRRTPPPPLPPVDEAAPVATATPDTSTSNFTPAGPGTAQTVGLNPSSVLPQPLQLTLTATEDCWIGLDVGGDRVENRVLKKGESYQITARQNASLAVGNAGGLLVAIDSGPPRPLGNRGEVKRNIPLSPEAISALSALPESEPVPVKPIG